MNQIAHEALKAEALERMKLLGLSPEVIQQFEQTGQVSTCSCTTGKPLTTPDQTQALIPRLEQQHDILIYLNVHTESAFGTLDNLFFVGKYDEEWAWERADLQDDYALVYVHNWTYPQCSEIGTIGFERTGDGGILRSC